VAAWLQTGRKLGLVLVLQSLSMNPVHYHAIGIYLSSFYHGYFWMIVKAQKNIPSGSQGKVINHSNIHHSN